MKILEKFKKMYNISDDNIDSYYYTSKIRFKQTTGVNTKQGSINADCVELDEEGFIRSLSNKENLPTAVDEFNKRFNNKNTLKFLDHAPRVRKVFFKKNIITQFELGDVCNVECKINDTSTQIAITDIFFNKDAMITGFKTRDRINFKLDEKNTLIISGEITLDKQGNVKECVTCEPFCGKCGNIKICVPRDTKITFNKKHKITSIECLHYDYKCF